MYPSRQKYCRYPIGVPECITGNFIPIRGTKLPYFGLIKCKVLPPRGLFHPVLPLRIDKKLLFPLCHKCASLRQAECDHSDEERSWIGTWATPEVEKALEKQYRVLEVYEVWHYKESSQFDGTDPETGLLKMKLIMTIND